MTNLYQPQSDRIDRALLYAGFVVTGIITTLLAPMLPVFAARWSLSDAMVGCFFPAQFIGSKLGNIILSAGLIQRASFRSIFVLGYAAMCAGVGALGVGLGWPLSLVAVFCYGIGIGITIPATNLWISKANPAHRSAELNLLNLAWSVGALLGPAALAACNRLWNFATFLFAVAALAAAVSACLLCTNRPRLISESVEAAEIERQRVPVPAVVCMALLFFLYVGVENSVSGWISSIARGASSTNSHWMLAPSFFWGMLLAGRATAACVVRRVQELRLAIAGLVLAVSGTSLLILANHIFVVYAGASICGLGLAPVYPIAIASATRAFSPRIATGMFFLSGFGGATLPWIVGMMSTQLGSLRAGLIVPLAATVTMLLLEFASGARNGRCTSPDNSVRRAKALIHSGS